MEIFITGFQDQLKTLCIQHVDILHDDQTNVAFVPFQSHDDMNQVINNASPVLVIVTRYYGRAAGQTADDMQLKQFVGIRFCVAAIPDPVINYSDLIATAQDKAFQIMLDFLVKFGQIQRDDNCGPLRNLELQSASWSEIPEQPFISQHYGWDLTIPFNSELPDYDASKWTGTPGGTTLNNFTDMTYQNGSMQFTGGDLVGATEVQVLGFATVTIPEGQSQALIGLPIGTFTVQWRKTKNGVSTSYNQKQITINQLQPSNFRMYPLNGSVPQDQMDNFYDFPVTVCNDIPQVGGTHQHNPLTVANSAQDYMDIWNADSQNQILGQITAWHLFDNGITKFYFFDFTPAAGQNYPDYFRFQPIS